VTIDHDLGSGGTPAAPRRRADRSDPATGRRSARLSVTGGEPEFEDIYAALSRPAWQDAAHIRRRRFLQGAAAVGAVTAAPGWVARAAEALTPIGTNDGVVVVVMLGGGNDGLNTLAPVGDAAYARLRPQLALRADQVLPIAPGVGLHPSLRTVKARFDQGKVAIVRGVGQAGSDLSHFSSMANWMAGTTSTSRTTGWLGRWLDTLPDGADGLRGVAIGSSVPLHMLGATSQVTAMPTKADLFGSDREDPWNPPVYDTVRRFSSNDSGQPLTGGPWVEAVATGGWRAMDLAEEMSAYFTPALPGGDLVKQLTLAARLVNANVGVRVITAQLGSFDTHSGQPYEHARLLTELDAGIDAFFNLLNPTYSKRVALMTFSEFGRRPGQNASQGTDHGDAAPLFVIGDNVRGGLHGAQPSLTDLDSRGDLKVNVDFRSVYQSVLSSWLGADARRILGADFTPVDLFLRGPGQESIAGTGPWAPFASSTRLVEQQYLDFMGRPGDPGGIAYWAGLLDRKVLPVEAVIASFLASAEFGQAVSPAARIGLACTGAPTAFAVTVQWAAMVRAGTPLIDVVRQAVSLPAFAGRYPVTLGNAAFVDKAHRDVLGRAPGATWTATWVAKLTAGTASRADVMLDLSECPENVTRARPGVDVTMTYVGMLRREPEAGGFAYWVDKVRGGVAIGHLIRLFFESPEYRQRFR
jgi:uncharacterized protein (DUF1501 family)